jgi:Ca2+-binding RTX toxin-like protein
VAGTAPRRAGRASGFLALVAVAAAAAFAPAPAEAGVDCALRAHVLDVVAGGDFDAIRVVRSGDEIEVAEGDSLLFEQLLEEEETLLPVECSGRTPTVANVDEITIRQGRDVEFLELEIALDGGRFAPGHTAERDGSSEIEFALSIGGEESFAMFRGGDESEHFELALSGEERGLNLNADEPVPDADVSLGGLEYVALFAGGGNDRFVTSGRGGLESGESLGLFAAGGVGADLLSGSSRTDFLAGGRGNDEILGYGGRDFIATGAGRDRVHAGGGGDEVRARKGGRDRVNCGSGRDLAGRDKRDRLRRCEGKPRRSRVVVEASRARLGEWLRAPSPFSPITGTRTSSPGSAGP